MWLHYCSINRPALACALVAPLALAISPLAMGITEVEGERTIGAGALRDDYFINSGATLISNGATIDFVRMDPGAAFMMNGGSIQATGNHFGVNVGAGGTATIANGASVVANLHGLRLTRDSATETGSAATISDSRVQGNSGGAYVSADSQLNVQRSELIGTGANATAADLFGDARLNAEDSTLTGESAGVRILGGAAQGGGTTEVNLLRSRVEGINGPAIQVGNATQSGASANIVVGPDSSLVGGDGVLLGVSNNSSASMRVNGSQLKGDVRVEEGSSANLTLENQASLTGRLDNVAGLTLNSQGRWNMVEDSQVGSLAMNEGVVSFGEPGQYQTLTVGTLAGSGTFIMDADFGGGQSDFLQVGTATGNHGLLVSRSGTEPTEQNSLHLVHADAGDARFSLINGPVDLGAFSYELVQRDSAAGSDWYLDGSSKIISPGAASALALFNTAPTVWYGELSSLRSRMGELRLDQRKSGAWMRSYGNKFNVSESSGVAYSQVQQGISLGADAPLPLGDGQWLAGVMAGYSTSDLNVARGASADVKSYYLGGYATWLDASSGYYFDAVVKLNRFDNESKVSMSDGTRTEGNYDTLGMGGSLEFGRHISLSEGYFVEPFTQWSAVRIQGQSYSLDNGLRAKGDSTQSLLGKAGATVGRNFELDDGRVLQPYMRLAYVHEFANNNQAKVNDHRFDNDLSGSRGEVGVGVAVSLAERWQVHADFDYSNGSKIEQPWGANVGLHYSW